MTWPHSRQCKALLAGPRLGLWLAALALLLTSPSLFGGLASDDCMIRACLLGSSDMQEIHRAPWDAFTFCNGSRDVIRTYMNRGLLPWWTPPDLRLAFWRPLSSLSHYADFAFLGDSALLMHLHSMLWFAAVALAVTALYRRFFPVAWVAGLAALLYVIDDAHGFPVGWLANRNSVMATVFAVLVLAVHDRWRRDKWRPGILVGPLCLALGLGCGETALAIGGYLAAYVLFLERGPWRTRAMTLAPYAVVVAVWFFVYQRWGYGATGSGQYLDPIREPVLYLVGAVQRLPILLLSQLGFPSSSLWPYSPGWLALAHLALAVAFLTFLAWALWPMVRHEPLARFWTLGMLLSTLPFCATYPNDRLLFLTGIGGMGLVAQFAHTRLEPPAWATPDPRPKSGRVLAVCWVVIHGILAPLSLPPATLSPVIVGRLVERASNSMPNDLRLPERDLVIVNTPTDYLIVYVPFMRVRTGDPLPRCQWTLCAGPGAVTVERTTRNTIVLEPENGFFADGLSRVLRGTGHPVPPMYTVQLPDFSARVLAMTEDGRPARVAFTFAKPLEDRSLEFVTWTGRAYSSFEAPAIGGKTRIPAIPWNWWF